MGSNVITSAQVNCLFSSIILYSKTFDLSRVRLAHSEYIKQGEELRKQIGAAAYIECSSKTQQVDFSIRFCCSLNSHLVEYFV